MSELELMRQQLNLLLNDFLWLLERHPENDGEYARNRIEQVLASLAGDAE
jgi:hypothetical protein